MTLTRPYSANFYVGDGETKAFSFVFDEVSDNFVKCIVAHSDGTTSVPTYTVDLDLSQVVFGDETPAPTADDIVCIYRETPTIQDTPFRTLQGYNAQALENILSKIVAMIQEIKSTYFSTQVLQGDAWQLDLLTSADDGATVNIDYTAKKLVKGLYFQITNGNLQVSADGSSYITMPKSSDIAEFRQQVITLPDLTVIKKLQYRVNNEWFDAETNAQATADEALALAQSVQSDLSTHTTDLNNPHQTSLVNLKDTNITSPANGQFIMFDGLKWKNVFSSATVYWGQVLGNITDQTDLMNKFTEYVRTDGTSVMTAPLLMRATDDFKCAIAPYWDGIGFFKLNDNNSVTLIASLEYQDSFTPAENNVYNIGSTSKKWKNLYLSGKLYVATINNGADLSVPAKSGTLATTGDVELAARSGRMLTDQGVWYAKMYSATVPPSAEDDTNYADFSQVDSDNNPIIVIYTRTSGAWVQTETITPPSDYDGYVPITSKIWDISEQSGQQGGRVLWNHTSKEFTPYPTIISFEDIEVTGESTVIMPLNPSGNQIVNKDYVDSHVPTGGYHPSLFAHEWDDKIRNDVQWLRADTFSWQSGSVYQAAYKHLRNDMFNWYSWENNGTTIYTKKAYPEVGEKAYSDSALTTEVGEITDVTDTLDITVEKITVNSVVYDSVSGSNISPTTETVGGVTVQYIPAEDGHKIVTDFHESEVADVYTATGVAWYYIIDYGSKRFKLPRTKFGVTGLRDTVGNYVAESLPNITFAFNQDGNQNNGGGLIWGVSGALTATSASSRARYNPAGTGTVNTGHIEFSASNSSSAYQDSAPVQQRATQMYLYFYVGEFTQTAIENTAGLNAELFNDKVDVGHQVIAFQAPTAGNNYTWYRKYVDGWVEQGGEISSASTSDITVSLPITMENSHYAACIFCISNSVDPVGFRNVSVWNRTTTSFECREQSGIPKIWEVKGMASS